MSLHGYSSNATALLLLATATIVLLVPGFVCAQPEITINDFETLPDEAFFAANPNAIVHVKSIVAPGTDLEPFNFHGATVHVGADGALGWNTMRSFIDHVNLNLTTGGDMYDSQTFRGLTGTTHVVIAGGESGGRLAIQGNSQLTVSSGIVGGRRLNTPEGAPSIIASDMPVRLDPRRLLTQQYAHSGSCRFQFA